jgi:excisionase family DNA binding protein
MAGPVLIDLSSPQFCGHLAQAIHDHRERWRLNGVATPSELTELENYLLNRVRTSQDGSASSEPPFDWRTMDEAVLAVTLAEAGRRIGKSESSVKRLITEGKLPAIQILGSRRIRLRDLEAYLESCGRQDDDEESDDD